MSCVNKLNQPNQSRQDQRHTDAELELTQTCDTLDTQPSPGGANRAWRGGRGWWWLFVGSVDSKDTALLLILAAPPRERLQVRRQYNMHVWCAGYGGGPRWTMSTYQYQ